MKLLTENSTVDEIEALCRTIVKTNKDKYKFLHIFGMEDHNNPIPSGWFNLTIYDNNIIIKRSYDYPQNTFVRENNLQFIETINSILEELTINPPIDWNRRYLQMASGEINTWSKDPSTKVSAVIFKDKHPIASNYNGFPPGIADTPERLNNRELKYKLVKHAEANAIAVCAKLGIATNGCTMAVTHFPCSDCAGLMIAAGIKKVIVQTPTEDFLSRWSDSISLSKDMFDEADVELIVIDLKETSNVNT